jgi:methionyl-tRNA formyltransferase
MDKRIIILGFNNIVIALLNVLKEEGVGIRIISSQNQLEGSNPKYLNQAVLATNISLLEELKKLDCKKDDLILSVGCPWILKKEHLECLGNRVLNLHGTHLPMYRGGTIYSWYILNKRKTGLCALHQLTEVIDAGGIVAWSEYLLPSGCRKPIDLMRAYETKNVAFLSEIIEKWVSNDKHPADLSPIAQPEYLSSYWPRLLAKDHSWINWDWNGDQIETFICAFDDPYLGANTRWRNLQVRLKDVVFQAGTNGIHPFQYGMVFRKNNGWLNIAVQGGELIVSTILNENNENIISKIDIGERIYSLPTDLINQYTRVIKSNSGLESKKYW